LLLSILMLKHSPGKLHGQRWHISVILVTLWLLVTGLITLVPEASTLARLLLVALVLVAFRIMVDVPQKNRELKLCRYISVGLHTVLKQSLIVFL
jgi:hypothetical protein